MNVLETKRTLMLLPPRESLLIEGNHGLGKSQVVAQAAAQMSVYLGKPFGFIDFILSKKEVTEEKPVSRMLSSRSPSTSYISGLWLTSLVSWATHCMMFI